MRTLYPLAAAALAVCGMCPNHSSDPHESAGALAPDAQAAARSGIPDIGSIIPVKQDEDGRRSVGAEIEVPGSPEQVWRAIATGEGMSSWFVPSTVEERLGGRVVCSFGPGMDAVAKITQWNPPRSYTAEAGEGRAKVATEWIVEARTRGTCVVRVVHRWFADSDERDALFEGQAYGWATSYFRILRLYLTHFSGQKCSAFDLAAHSKASAPQTWRIIKSALKVDEKAGRAVSAPGAPELSGVVESAQITDPEFLRIRRNSPQIAAALKDMGDEDPELLLRLDRPAPGLAHVVLMCMGEQTMVSIRYFLYGDQGAEAAAEAKRQWNDWLAERLPQ